MHAEADQEKPDLEKGVPLSDLIEGEPFAGQVGGEAVVLVKQGGLIRALAGTCTHYGGPLAEGLVVGDTIRCPWHHACFSLDTGAAIGAPALAAVACYEVEQDGDTVKVSGKRDGGGQPSRAVRSPGSIVVVGGGAAGAACVDMLRQSGYEGPLTLVGDEEPGPVDRPNLSKDYLAGNAPEEWIPLNFASEGVETIIGDRALRIDTAKRLVDLESGRSVAYEKLLLATGAEPRRLDIPGTDLAHVRVLRTLADSRAIIDKATEGAKCVVIGSSFIGLEVAASLRNRKVDVTVVSPETAPLERVLGPDLAAMIRALHEEHRVRFILGTKPKSILDSHVELENGDSLPATLVVMGVGVQPRTALAEAAGLRVDKGVVVDELLRTSDPHVYAAGDIARYPDFINGSLGRVEHWVHAERQGQAAARAMLGIEAPYGDVPFFWSAHYDVTVAYVGHVDQWDQAEVHGDPEKHDACVAYRKDDQILAVATVGRDRVSLEAEALLGRRDQSGLRALIASQ